MMKPLLLAAALTAALLAPATLAAQGSRTVKETFEAYPDASGLGRNWSSVGPGLSLSDAVNHTPGGRKAALLPAEKGARSLRRNLTENPTHGSLSLWCLDSGDPSEAWSVTCGDGVSGNTVIVYTVPWSPSGGKQLNWMFQVDRVNTEGKPSGIDRTAGWVQITFNWGKEGCSVSLNGAQVWSAAELTEGFSFIEVGRFWSAEQPYEAHAAIAFDDITATMDQAPAQGDADALVGKVQRPSYAYAAMQAGPLRRRDLEGKPFWAMNYFGGDAAGARSSSTVLAAAREYKLGDSWYSWANFDDADMGFLRRYASDAGPLLVTTDPDGMQRLTFKLTPERERNLKELDALRPGRLVAALHGEWDNALDFYFGGLPKGTATRKQAYEAWEKHYKTVRDNVKGRLISVNGYGFYQHYGARWGSDRLIGVEVCENIPGSQPHYSFTRGAGRQYGLAWYAQMSPWYAGTILSYDRYSPWTPGPGSGTWGPDHGHSVNLLERHWYAAWLGGAAVVCAEANGWNAFNDDRVDGLPKLSTLGDAWRKFVAFTSAHPNRGVPVTPFAAVMDQYNGFNGGDQPWRSFKRTQGDEMATDLFQQFYPGAFDRGLMARDQGYLTHTPYGDTLDALLSDASADVLASYPVLFCVGDFEPDAAFAQRLLQAAQRGSTVVVHRSHATGPLSGLLPADAASEPVLSDGIAASKVGKGWVILIDRPALRVPRALTRALAQAVLPVSVEGRVQMTLARTEAGWVIGLINNEGVHKPSPTSAPVVDPSAAVKARIFLPAAWRGPVTDWQTGARAATQQAGTQGRLLEVALGPGEVKVVSVDLTGPGPKAPAKRPAARRRGR